MGAGRLVMKQAIRFIIAFGLLVVLGAGVVVTAVVAGINAIGWVIGR